MVLSFNDPDDDLFSFICSQMEVSRYQTEDIRSLMADHLKLPMSV